ncbi:MAG: 50S ribosomal protein L32 [Mariprofundaceae bacterium]
MAVPKRKTSTSRRNSRRSHDALTNPSMSQCSNCGETRRPHHACPHCGYYKGHEVMAKTED